MNWNASTSTIASRRTALAQGCRLGPYQVDRLIGEGGMGEVYRARDTRLNRDVALKVLTTRHPADPESLARFAQEAKTTALLNHPNIVAVYDVGSRAGVPFVISELLDGETLRMKMRADLPPSAAVRYALEIAHGLVAAHQLGIAHRDLKPENVFVTRDDRVKILDFGLATCRDETLADLHDSSLSTRPGSILGTVGYMSPEQVRGHQADHRSDIFSLGVILYEMIAGTAPFHGPSAVDTLHAILHEDPASLRSPGRRASATLERVVRHCLEKAPDARFQTARDFIFALELVMRAKPRTGRPPKKRTPSVPLTRRLFAALLQLM